MTQQEIAGRKEEYYREKIREKLGGLDLTALSFIYSFISQWHKKH